MLIVYIVNGRTVGAETRREAEWIDQVLTEGEQRRANQQTNANQSAAA